MATLDADNIVEGMRFEVVGRAENSVVGMNMIQQLKPHIVIMPQYMVFWNAEDLINRLTQRGIRAQLILVCSNMVEFQRRMGKEELVSAGLETYFPDSIAKILEAKQ